ncbi:MAG TPA: hypothetical protein VLC51_04745 [Nitrospira sp.]|nr:hypothetical protein [Nitrospira sp.]
MKAAVLNALMGHIQITTIPAVSRQEWKTLLQETLARASDAKGSHHRSAWHIRPGGMEILDPHFLWITL